MTGIYVPVILLRLLSAAQVTAEHIAVMLSGLILCFGVKCKPPVSRKQNRGFSARRGAGFDPILRCFCFL